MLNPFPIQFLALLAYFLLRVCVGSICVYLGFTQLRTAQALRTPDQPHWPLTPFVVLPLIAGEIAFGLMFILGWYTQYAALGIMILTSVVLIWYKRFSILNLPPRIFYTLLLFTAISLFITGAGALAFDLPI